MIPKIPPLLRHGLAGSRSAIWATVGFSFALNLLTLAMPVFTIQLYNRVLSSGSGATLALISLAAIIAFAVAGVLEDVRAQLLVAIGCRLDAALSAPLFSRLVEAAVRSGGARNEAQALRDLDTLRTTLTGGGALALLDLPWSPLFIVACGMLHPLLGLLSLVGAGVLIGLALLNQSVVARPLSDSAKSGEASYGLTEAVIRNAEVVQAMGMLPAIMGGWRGLRAGLMHQQSVASVRNSQVGSLIKFVRMLLQIAIFAAGAWLVVDQKLTGGALFAASLLTTRALAPIDQVVGVWRQLAIGVASLRRVEAAFAAPDRMSAMALPHPEGRLSVENLTYVPAGARAPAVMNVSFALEPGESLGVVGASAAGVRASRASMAAPASIGPPSLIASTVSPSISTRPHGNSSLTVRPGCPTSSRTCRRRSGWGSTSAASGAGGSTRLPSGVSGNQRNASDRTAGTASTTTVNAAMPAVAPCSKNAVATAAMSAAMLTKPRMPPDGTNTSSTITPSPSSNSVTTHSSVIIPGHSAA